MVTTCDSASRVWWASNRVTPPAPDQPAGVVPLPSQLPRVAELGFVRRVASCLRYQSFGAMKNEERSQALTLVGFALTLIASVKPALACSCGPITVAEAFTRADAVFVGKVIGVEEYSEGARISFLLVESWKGPQRSHLTVLTPSTAGQCGFPVLVGSTYLVYARYDSRLGSYVTGLCSRNRFYLCAREEIDGLGSPRWRSRLATRLERPQLHRIMKLPNPLIPCIQRPERIAGEELDWPGYSDAGAVFYQFPVQIEIDKSGRVRSAVPKLSGYARRLEEEIRTKVPRWRFRPAHYYDRPLHVIFELTLGRPVGR